MMLCVRRHFAGAEGALVLLAIALSGLLGSAQTYTFEGFVYAGTPFETSQPQSGVSVRLFGDDDLLPDNGPLTLLAETVTDPWGGFSLAWQPAEAVFAGFHVRETDPPGVVSTGAQAPPPGSVSDANTVSYLDIPFGAYSAIGFWDRPAGRAAEPLPDLVIDAFVMEPVAPASGSSASVRVTIRNEGSAPSGAFSVQFVHDGHTLPTRLSIGGLSPGGSGTVGTAIYNLSSGAHLLEVIADPENAVDEDDETNNRARLGFTVGEEAPGRVALPDLTISDAVLTPRIGAPHELLTLTCSLANAGDASADATLAVVLDDAGTQRAATVVRPLAGGDREDLSFSFVLGELGEQRVRVVADPGNAIRELDEENNAKDLGVWIARPRKPDLVPVEFGPGARLAGAGGAMIVRVENQGEAGAPAFAVTLSAEGRPVCPPTIVPSLDIDATIDVVLFLPGDATTLTATIDPENWVEESDETNNRRDWHSASPGRPDVVVESIEKLPNPLGEGEMILVTVANHGSATARTPQLLVALVDTTYDEDPLSSAWLLRTVLAELPDLAPGASYAWSQTWPPQTEPAARWALLGEVDPFALIDELDETNNALRTLWLASGGE